MNDDAVPSRRAPINSARKLSSCSPRRANTLNLAYTGARPPDHLWQLVGPGTRDHYDPGARNPLAPAHSERFACPVRGELPQPASCASRARGRWVDRGPCITKRYCIRAPGRASDASQSRGNASPAPPPGHDTHPRGRDLRRSSPQPPANFFSFSAGPSPALVTLVSRVRVCCRARARARMSAFVWRDGSGSSRRAAVRGGESS
ncbi:hypothetical protein BD413DRAFT_283475 [Trametes elegans]|nr:hypothetical protein BD413DRAFT_283475 [Trametes elegans]